MLACVMSVSVCEDGRKGGVCGGAEGVFFWFTFFVLALHIFPLRQKKLLMRQAGHSQRRMHATVRDTFYFSFSSFLIYKSSKVQSESHVIRRIWPAANGLLNVWVAHGSNFTQKGAQLSMFTISSLSSLLFVFTCHPPPLPASFLCSCADQMSDTLVGPVLSNGAGLEFDTLTPPISAARHQEPHRMLAGKCRYCLLEFLWCVSNYWRTRYRTFQQFRTSWELNYTMATLSRSSG